VRPAVYGGPVELIGTALKVARKEIEMIAKRMSWATRAVVFAAACALAAPAMAQAKASTLDTAKAKAFIGEWTLTLQGGRGPQERPLTIKDVGGKVAAELGGGRGGPITITDISMAASDLVLKFKQTGRGGEVDVVMTLTLKDGALTVKQEAGGNAMTGTGKKT
jgi:hypothetical protein